MPTTNPFSQLTLTAEELLVSKMLLAQRQCTSVELINKAKISNPTAMIANLNQQLAAIDSPWLISCSISRGRGKNAEIGYYRMLRQPFKRP